MEGRLKKTRIEGVLEAREIRELPVIKGGNYGSPGLAILSIRGNGYVSLVSFFGRIGYGDAVRMVKGRQSVFLEQDVKDYFGFFGTLNQHFNEGLGDELPLRVAYETLLRNHLKIDDNGFIEPDSLNPPSLPKEKYYSKKRYITPIKRNNYLFLVSNL